MAAALAYVASHDLQAPLRQVAGYVSLLAQRFDTTTDKKTHQYVQFITSGVARMQNLISGLLKVSRVHTDDTNTGPVRAGEALDEALSLLSMSIDDSGATITAGVLPASLIFPPIDRKTYRPADRLLLGSNLTPLRARRRTRSWLRIVYS